MLSFSHQVFIEVARKLSFTKASQTLFLSQSAISKHIKSLEVQYQTGLFERLGNRVTLTEAGQVLFQKLQNALQLQNELHQEIQELTTAIQWPTKLTVGASTTIALYVLPQVLSGFLHLHPSLQVSLLNRNSETVLKALLDHEIDVGITEELSRITTVSYTPFMTDEVLAVCSRKSDLNGQRLTLDQLKTVPLALREYGSGTLAVVEQALKEQGIRLRDLDIRATLGGTEALKNFVVADTCLAFLPKRAILREMESGELVEVPVQGISIQRVFNFIQRKGTENDRMITNFIRFAKRLYSEKE